jgi:hypothetical protein
LFCHAADSSAEKKPLVGSGSSSPIFRIAPHAHGEASVVMVTGTDTCGSSDVPFHLTMLARSHASAFFAVSDSFTRTL